MPDEKKKSVEEIDPALLKSFDKIFNQLRDNLLPRVVEQDLLQSLRKIEKRLNEERE